MKINRNFYMQQGFTLIELLIVMAILGMLAATIGPRVWHMFGKGQIDAAKNQISNLETIIDAYRLDTFKYPASLEDLVKNNSNHPKWDGPYVKKGKLPKDPWGNDYQYRKPGQDGRDYDLFSFGADGQQGGEDDKADIYN